MSKNKSLRKRIQDEIDARVLCEHYDLPSMCEACKKIGTLNRRKMAAVWKIVRHARNLVRSSPGEYGFLAKNLAEIDAVDAALQGGGAP